MFAVVFFMGTGFVLGFLAGFLVGSEHPPK